MASELNLKKKKKKDPDTRNNSQGEETRRAGKCRVGLGTHEYRGVRNSRSWKWAGQLESNPKFLQGDLLSEPAFREAGAAACRGGGH